MQSDAASVAEYLDSLPEDRRAALQGVRRVILGSLPKGYEEGMQYGMIGYYVPHSLYPSGYHCSPSQPLPFASLASQKRHMAFYGMGIYMDDALARRFAAAWKKTGKKLDMGKCCVRFRKLEDVALDVVAEAVAAMPVTRYVELYERSRRAGDARRKGYNDGKYAASKTPKKGRVKKEK